VSEPKQEAPAPAFQLEKVKEHKLATGVLGLDLSPDAKRAFACCIDGSVQAVALDSGEQQRLGEHESYASSVARIAGTPLVVSGGYDGALLWFDTSERKLVRKVAAHRFWSWQVAGGYKYEPQAEREPSVRVYEAVSGKLAQSFAHVPPVQAVAFSADGQFLAAGNLMGEVRVWEVASGKQVAQFTTPSFTGWGIIKGHYYTGGIYAMQFAANDAELYVAGMGSTTDPAAGNGKQLWQRFDWRAGRKLSETSDGDAGKGLMETLAFHPSGKYFVMAGRLENGKWTMAFFDVATGALLHSLDTKSRVTKALFTADGRQLVVGEALGQGKPKDGKVPDFGRMTIFRVG
jgi:WD40 repeat protein